MNLEKAMAPHSSTLAWKIPWTEEPGRLQSMGSLRVWHYWATSLSLFTFMRWRRKWQPTPVFLPGESQGQGGPSGLPSMGSQKNQTGLSDFTFTFYFHALEKEMATHSSVLAWRIPGMGEPGGLLSMGLHRVRHDWSDLAAAAANFYSLKKIPAGMLPLDDWLGHYWVTTEGTFLPNLAQEACWWLSGGFW